MNISSISSVSVSIKAAVLTSHSCPTSWATPARLVRWATTANGAWDFSSWKRLKSLKPLSPLRLLLVMMLLKIRARLGFLEGKHSPSRQMSTASECYHLRLMKSPGSHGVFFQSLWRMKMMKIFVANRLYSTWLSVLQSLFCCMMCRTWHHFFVHTKL